MLPAHILILIIVISAVILTALVLLTIAMIEPHKLNVTHEDYSNGNSETLNICFISDLHAEFCFISAERVIEELKNEMKDNKVDMLIFGGDICNNPKKVSKGILYLNKLKSFCDANDITFAGVTGNHDVTVSAEDISKCGFIDLRNEDLIYKNSNGKRYFITGVTDSGREHRVWPQVKSKPQADDTSILVAHNPDLLLYTQNIDDIDYCLSGHIHGGQIRTPFRIEFTVLRKDELPKEGIIAGQYVFKNCKLFISKGIGCILLPLRLGSKPEINFLKIG